jgi:hypothetical protein
MPESALSVKHRKIQELLDGLHNEGFRLKLLAFGAESTGVDGDYSPPKLAGSKRGAVRRPQVGWYHGKPGFSSLQDEGLFCLFSD